MINIDKTIYESVIKKLNLLRYQAQDNPKHFKDLLKLIILHDVLEWSVSLDIPQDLQEQLKQKELEIILCNPAISIQYSDSSLAYVNVNTPQTTDTWKRVWDSKNVITIPDNELFTPCDNPECSNTPERLIKVTNIIIKEII